MFLLAIPLLLIQHGLHRGRHSISGDCALYAAGGSLFPLFIGAILSTIIGVRFGY